MNQSLTILIFGFTGDLTKRKLIPALYALFCDKKLPSFIIVGTGLEPISTQDILNNARLFIEELDPENWNLFCQHIFYHPADFMNNQESANTFYAYVKALELLFNTPANRLVYMAVAAHLFAPITTVLVSSGLISRTPVNASPWHRIVYEKPFGHNKESAHEINQKISALLYEHQVYRIDHYLTKELVSNISLVRFTNCIFEPLWNNKYIEQIHIVLNETIDIETRGFYYDQYGALRDVAQNHMMQMLSLIAMEAPESLLGDAIRDKRAALLENVTFIDGLRGQYDGYQNEPGVSQSSQTETYALLAFEINTPRWKGVPFFFSTGKALSSREVSIKVAFKPVDCLLEEKCTIIGPKMESNWLTFMISPEAVFSLQLNVKKPGKSDMVVPALMNFSHDCIFSMRQSHAYEVLLEEVMRGEQASSVRFDEIEQAWSIIDQIEKQKLPLFCYPKGSSGPKEREQFMHTYNMRQQT